ncbi:MAG: AraC family transcriptional regulator [Bacteroidota bacterium]
MARKIGYRNPEHFTSAFKKQFGVSPSKFKN